VTFLLTTPILTRAHTHTPTGLCILSAYLVKAYKFYYLPEYVPPSLPPFLLPALPYSLPPSLPPSLGPPLRFSSVYVCVGGLARLFSPSKDELDFLSFTPPSLPLQVRRCYSRRSDSRRTRSPFLPFER